MRPFENPHMLVLLFFYTGPWIWIRTTIIAAMASISCLQCDNKARFALNIAFHSTQPRWRFGPPRPQLA